MSTNYITEAELELQKVFRLAAAGHSVQMFSEYIDSIWHGMLDQPERYMKFSREACGVVITHDETDGRGVPQFVETYELNYGKLPEVWFRDASGELDAKAFDCYKSGGEIQASWKCSPTHNCAANIKPKPKRQDPPSPATPKEPENPNKPSTTKKD